MTVQKDGNGNKIKMNMMKFKCIYALIAVVLLATACQDEEIIQPVNPGLQGAEITFGARAGFENSNPGSRTEYSGVHYTYNGAKFERIDWVKGDTVQVYSPQAGGTNPSHYTVIGFKDGDEAAGSTGKGEDYAALERIGESSLQWGNGEHTFYAMYPSTLMFSEGTEEYQNIKLEGTTMHAFIADEQVPASVTSDGAGNWVAAPDMKYAFMVAKDKASQTDNNGNVSLSFVPAVTAVQLKLVLPDNSSSTEKVNQLNIGTVRVEGTGIAGSYTADLGAWNPETTTYPTYKAVSTTNYVEIPVWHKNNDGNLEQIKIEPGHSLTFTVFLVPGGNISGLKVGISDVGISYQQKALGVEVVSNKKNVINGMQLPVSTTPVVIDYSKWMALLDANTTMKALSIPGTGGSFSYGYTNSDSANYKQQYKHMDLEAQWKLGIRAFEIVSERPSAATTSLGTENVKCNKASMGVSVLSVLQNLLSKVSSIKDSEGNPTETAVLILTYQPEGSGRNRNGATYASSLKLMYDDLTAAQKSQIIQYTPDLTLSAARGNVMIFCRINQKDENDNGDTNDATAFELATATLKGTNITLIDGCGTGKDRWGSRGYKVNGNVAYDAANTGDSNKSVDYYLQQTGGVLSGGFSWPDWNNVSVPNAENGDLNFGFATNYSDVTCWYQEWARVVPEGLIDKNLGWYQIYNTGLGIADIYPDVRWFESYSEKLAAAKKTFDMAISGDYSDYIFINSLCGYFVDSKISNSYEIFTGSNDGGIEGNIKGLADKINPDFYSYVLTTGMSDKPGPTGIVMMDYVSNNPNAGGAYLLPSVIIANNLKPGMSTGGSSSGTGSGTGSGGSGI